MFISPLLLFYELGVLILGPEAIRNGAEVWMRQLLLALGIGQYFVLPFLTAVILLAAHHFSRGPWCVRSATLWGMAVESVLLAVVLRLLLGLQAAVFSHLTGPAGLTAPMSFVWAQSTGPSPATEFAAKAVAYVGAGVYEELVFRLILLTTIALVFKSLTVPSRSANVLGVCLSSLVFAAAHYVGPMGEPFAVFSMIFRLMAGVFFGMLFLYRGFGIAAGSHAVYDLLVGLL
ncbi:CPBP family glutamic-type intramembrane protease [Thermopirellula anaerolimosa]